MDFTPLIINCALTGMVPRKKDNPHTPVSPDEIASDAKRCFDAGGRVFHLHARSDDEEPTYKREIYEEIILKVKKLVPEAIICVSTSGRKFKLFEHRSECLHILDELKPDMASLTLGSMNFPKEASINDPQMIAQLASAMTERGIVPELEIFDMGMLDYAHYLISRNILKPPFVINIFLGSLGMLNATPLNLALIVERLPVGTCWSAAGIGRFQYQMNMLGIVMGGNVRTGLEDNLFMETEKITFASNERLVQRLVALSHSIGRPIATPAQARELLGLGNRNFDDQYSMAQNHRSGEDKK